ncbi:MAG: hydrogenase maturation nickel metallochaperone HypA [Syntrophomonadaceae bacterium]|nr:hydrogenase maturation nickel metallochaperone HypA [Syntrophomonadaceae bacterium]
MHEFSLIEGVLNMVRDSASQNNIGKVNRVKLVVGRLSMALPDSLHFAFEAICKDEDLFREAILEIEEKEIMCDCLACQRSSELKDIYSFICPACGSNRIEITQGRELYLDYYEGEEVNGAGSNGG